METREEKRKKFIEDAKKAYEEAIVNWKNLYESKKDCNFLDEDGYPTDDALLLVENWHFSDAKGFFEFIKSIWHLRSWGWNEISGGEDEFNGLKIDDNILRYHISTAGWSGNESIIRAMQKNDMMWFMNWVQSRRGGHYIFELKVFEDE